MIVLRTYLLGRVGTAILLVLVVVTIVFLALRAVPGDPAVVLANGAGPEVEARIRAELGLDQPLWSQYFLFLRNVVVFNFGVSFQNGQPVTQALLERFPNTLELMVATALVSTPLGIVFGTLAARRRGWADSMLSGFMTLGVSTPGYVVATILILVFSLSLKWLPASGLPSLTEDPAGNLRSIILPVTVLAIPFTAVVARVTRTSILETENQEWVRTARSWGMGDGKVFRSHILRNSLTPVATTIGLELGVVLGSTTIVESIFNYPGISAYLVHGVAFRDYPVVQGTVILIAVCIIFLNILVDVVYGVLDPRVRHQR